MQNVENFPHISPEVITSSASAELRDPEYDTVEDVDSAVNGPFPPGM